MTLKRFRPKATPRLELLDATMDCYVKWRAESRAVADSYRNWRFAADGKRRVAFDRYVAALDREEDAACGYRRVVERTHTA